MGEVVMMKMTMITIVMMMIRRRRGGGGGEEEEDALLPVQLLFWRHCHSHINDFLTTSRSRNTRTDMEIWELVLLLLGQPQYTILCHLTGTGEITWWPQCRWCLHYRLINNGGRLQSVIWAGTFMYQNVELSIEKLRRSCHFHERMVPTDIRSTSLSVCISLHI